MKERGNYSYGTHYIDERLLMFALTQTQRKFKKLKLRNSFSASPSSEESSGGRGARMYGHFHSHRFLRSCLRTSMAEIPSVIRFSSLPKFLGFWFRNLYTARGVFKLVDENVKGMRLKPWGSEFWAFRNRISSGFHNHQLSSSTVVESQWSRKSLCPNNFL